MAKNITQGNIDFTVNNTEYVGGFSVNAVDIDWNEAQINGATMTTSGEVVNAIR